MATPQLNLFSETADAEIVGNFETEPIDNRNKYPYATGTPDPQPLETLPPVDGAEIEPGEPLQHAIYAAQELTGKPAVRIDSGSEDGLSTRVGEFAPYPPSDWRGTADELRKALTEEEFASARR